MGGTNVMGGGGAFAPFHPMLPGQPSGVGFADYLRRQLPQQQPVMPTAAAPQFAPGVPGMTPPPGMMPHPGVTQAALGGLSPQQLAMMQQYLPRFRGLLG